MMWLPDVSRLFAIHMYTPLYVLAYWICTPTLIVFYAVLYSPYILLILMSCKNEDHI